MEQNLITQDSSVRPGPKSIEKEHSSIDSASSDGSADMSSASSRIEYSSSSADPSFADDMRRFSAILKRFSRRKEFGEFSKTASKNRDLEGRLAAKETEIATLRSEKAVLELAKETEIATLQSEKAVLNLAKQALFDGFQEKYTEWSTETNEQESLKRNVATLQQQLTQANQTISDSKDTLKNVQRQFEGCQGELIDCRSDLKKVNKRLESEIERLNKKQHELDGTRGSLKSCQDTLHRERQELGLEEPELDNLAARFNTFVETSHGLARRFFLTELTESENLTWGNISAELYQRDFLSHIPRKFPLSNSIPSKYLRMAMAEKIFSVIYHSDIFREYYLPESEEVGKILKQLYKESPRKEAIFRLLLLSTIKPEAEQSRVTSIVKSATDKVVDLLGPLLFAPNAEIDFRSEFERLLQDAADLWRHVQRSAKKGFVENEQEDGWDDYEEYQSALELRPDQEVHVPDEPSPIMSLFPRVVVDNFPISPGYALWSSQSTVVAADIELKSRNPMNGLVGNSTGGIQRRGTTRRFSNSGEDTPQSPRSSSGNLPVLRHTQNRSISLPRRGEHSGAPGRE